MASAMDFNDRKIPGVYVAELDAFPSPVTGVQTAIPAFIGFTEKAVVAGASVINQPVKIGSLAGYEAIFGVDHPPANMIMDVTDLDKINAGNFDFKVFDSAAC